MSTPMEPLVSQLSSLEPSVAALLERALLPNEGVEEVVRGQYGQALVLTDKTLYLRHRPRLSMRLDLWPGDLCSLGPLRLGVLAVLVADEATLSRPTSHHINVEKGQDAAIERVRRRLLHLPPDPAAPERSEDSDSWAAPLLRPDEQIAANFAGKRGGGLIFSTRAVYARVERGLSSAAIDRRWSVAAIASIDGGPLVRLKARDGDVIGQEAARFWVALDHAAKADVVDAWARLRSSVGEPGSESAAEAELMDLTETWTAPIVLRRYRRNPTGHASLRRDTMIVGRHGYRPASEQIEEGRVKVGELLLTGGIGAAIGHAKGKGGIREVGVINATFVREATEASIASLSEQLRELVALRDAGALTDAEFSAAKAKLLG
jgi:hypothetical protein